MKRWLVSLGVLFVVACGEVNLGQESVDQFLEPAVGGNGPSVRRDAGWIPAFDAGAGPTQPTSTDGGWLPAGDGGSTGGPGAPNVCVLNSNPRYKYVATPRSVCTRIDYACDPEQELFEDACGCGCVCRPPTDPKVRYLSDSYNNPKICQVISFQCQPGETGFSSDCGCGCITGT